MVYRDTFIFRQDISKETFDKTDNFQEEFERTSVGITLLEAGYKFQSSSVITVSKVITIELVYFIGVVPEEIGIYYFFMMRKFKNNTKVLDELQKKFKINRVVLQRILDNFEIQKKYIKMLSNIMQKKHEIVAGK